MSVTKSSGDNMSYDVIRSVRQLIESGVGDVTRLGHILDRLESGKYVYLSDQRYLENLLSTNEYAINKPPVTESPAVNLEKDLRDINLRLEKILQDKARNEKKITDSVSVKQIESTKTPQVNKEKVVRTKSEDTTLLFSVVLGLVSLHGIGHIYIRKIAKGIGLLVLSLSIFILSGLYLLGIIKDSIPPILHAYFIPTLIGGYFGLYAFQILDSRRLCATYNAYVLEHGKIPPWW
ncbi:MAG: hypothetical protein KGI10_02155 [Thaumarchaeota archaeon]|nr:hypothetical protein [Nitrososphaerota archaeon]